MNNGIAEYLEPNGTKQYQGRGRQEQFKFFDKSWLNTRDISKHKYTPLKQRTRRKLNVRTIKILGQRNPKWT